MDKGKRKNTVSVQAIVEEDIDFGPTGANDRLDDPLKKAPVKEHNAKQCTCYCAVHPPPNRHDDPLKKTPVKPEEHNAKQCTCQCTVHPPPKRREVKTLPCGCKTGGRNLVIFIDGTANQFGEKNTNVIELYNLVLKATSDNQHTWYNSGIGTYARPHWRSLHYWMQVFGHKIDLAIAWNFEKTLLEAYRWLVDNYQDGDCIFLFGFSRGACQARTLSGMIHKVGLLHKGNEAQIPFAFELYADPESGVQTTPPVGSTVGEAGVPMAKRFKDAFSRQGVRVHFVGAWDTVSSIGFARGKWLLPHTIDGMTHVCYFRQALALDERRVKFLPEYAWGGTTLPPPGTDRVSHDERAHPHTSEVWFPGTHSDIGGGNAINPSLDHSRPPLRWMASQAAALGLRIGPFKRELNKNEEIKFEESLTGFWHLFELLPFQRLTFSTNAEEATTLRPHLWEGRRIQKGQKIHYSFVEGTTTSSYIPKARPADGNPTFWEDLRTAGRGGSNQSIEIDAFYRAAEAVGKLLAGEEAADLFKEMIADATGYQFLYDEVIETLLSWNQRTPKLELEAKCHFLHDLIALFPNDLKNLKLEKWSRDPTLLDDLIGSGSAEYREAAQNFQHRFIKDVNCLLEVEGHMRTVSSVSFSPDGVRLVSGSLDRTIRIWDANTGKQVEEPLRGDTDRVRSVAISPDGKRIVSGSDDHTIRIWDRGAGMHVNKPLRGHTRPVGSVAISPDGKHIISGSRDNTIWIRDAEKGEQVGEPLRGHTFWVGSVAISPDNKRIVSGSNDGTIRIWDLEKGEQVVAPLTGHTDWVFSVAISPDGKWIVSGAADHTIRIWDLKEGVQVGKPLQGHTDSVRSVTISSESKYIVSGSYDNTIRIWDLETRVQVGEPLRGHTGSVRSVAISPDDKCIASGSDDRTIRIWRTEGILP